MSESEIVPDSHFSAVSILLTPMVSRTVPTLQHTALRMGLAANYERLLKEMVFAQVTSPDRKTLLAHQRLLLTQDSSNLLSILHKESDYVCENARLTVGIQRAFEDGKITQTQLARNMTASNNADLLAAISRVQRIVEAGEAHGLIEKEIKHATLHYVQGTRLLDSLMRCLAEEDGKLYHQIFLLKGSASSQEDKCG